MFPHDLCRGEQFSHRFTNPDKSSSIQMLPQTKISPAIPSPIITNGVFNVLFNVICSQT